MSSQLFCQHELRDHLEHRKMNLSREINNLDLVYMKGVDKGELYEYFLQRFQLQPPYIDKNKINISDSGDVEIDVSQDQKGTQVIFSIPYEGNSELFNFRPRAYFLTYPSATVLEDELEITLYSSNQDGNEIKREFERQVDLIANFLANIQTDVREYNNEIAGSIRDQIEKRMEKLQKDQGMVESLGFPIRRRKDPPQNYKVPDIRRKPEVCRPQAKQKTTSPDPYLDLEEYNHILNVIFNMGRVLEFSPNAFENTEEEDLRFHFLVQLNGQYEGRATGETFNYEGKTDILIKDNGQNLFIAECKFWAGPKGFIDTIDQLLKYVTWRDTKTAIIIFNRNKGFSAVLEKIKETVKQHPHYVRTESDSRETEFRYIFRNKDDERREFFLTVLAFDVPQ